ncbi:MAG: PH domain-containing protein [Chitinophagaceae bacterium]|nr:PH domain-containing protein [Chitinophagaceae bacterium]
MKTFDQPQRQSAFAVFMMFFHIFRVVVGQVWPAAIGLFFGKKENIGMKFLIIGGGLVVFILIKTLLDYWFMKFSIHQGQLLVRKGLFTKKTVTIPLERIQAVHLEQSLLHTLTRTYKVLIDTAGTDEEELKIYAIAAEDATALRYILLNAMHRSVDGGSDKQTIPATNYQLISKLNIVGLLKLSLSANHLETMGIIAAFVIGKYEDIKPLINKIPLLKQLQSYSDTMQFTWTVITSLVIISLLITMVISIVRTFLRFYDYTVRKDEKGFHIRWGLVQIKQKIIPFNKIQMLSWRSNFIRRLIGLGLLSLKVAGQKEEKVKLRLELPITSPEQVATIIQTYQSSLPAQEDNQGYQIHHSYIFQRAFFITLPFLLVLTTGAYFVWNWNALLILLWWPLSMLKNWWYWNNFRFWIADTGVQRYASTFGKNEILLNWNNIQYVQLRQSLFQKKKGLATLFLHTAGGRFELPFIQYEQGLAISNYALYKTESTQQNWM